MTGGAICPGAIVAASIGTSVGPGVEPALSACGVGDGMGGAAVAGGEVARAAVAGATVGAAVCAGEAVAFTTGCCTGTYVTAVGCEAGEAAADGAAVTVAGAGAGVPRYHTHTAATQATNSIAMMGTMPLLLLISSESTVLAHRCVRLPKGKSLNPRRTRAHGCCRRARARFEHCGSPL